MPADIGCGGHGLLPIQEIEVDHRMAPMGFAFLAGLATECGAAAKVTQQILAANTGQEVSDLAIARGLCEFHDRLCERAC